MNKSTITLLLFLVATALASCSGNPSTADSTGSGKDSIIADPLPSWNEGPAKQRILDFIRNTVDSTGKDYVPLGDRIACFDNDGTLWGEQPYYFQLAFILDKIKQTAPLHPEWKTKQPFKSVLSGDLGAVMKGAEASLVALLSATHSGMDAATFDASVKNWMDTATHPKTGKHYNEMRYQPMVELLSLLRANGYKTFIVSGGGVDFMRAWAEKAYGIPPYQVVGSSGKVKYEFKDGKAYLLKEEGINFIDDKEGKPVGIYQHIGKIPVFTAGNSDGDYAMLQYTTNASGARFGMIVHHTDSIREVAYDRQSHIGRLDKGLDDAAANKWLLVDMKKDWKQIYVYE